MAPGAEVMAVDAKAGFGFRVHLHGPADVGKTVIVAAAVARANQQLGSFVRESPPREEGGSGPWACPGGGGGGKGQIALILLGVVCCQCRSRWDRLLAPRQRGNGGSLRSALPPPLHSCKAELFTRNQQRSTTHSSGEAGPCSTRWPHVSP